MMNREFNMETHTGLFFDLKDPKPSMVRPKDVAWGLAHTCRYGGHVDRFYSVAEHCCLMADYALKEGLAYVAATECLVHDAAEAYVGDLVKGVKDLVPSFDLLETKVMPTIRTAWSMRENSVSDTVKGLDRRILVDEAKVLCRSGGNWRILEGVVGLGVELKCWVPERAAQEYLDRLFNLVPGVYVQ